MLVIDRPGRQWYCHWDRRCPSEGEATRVISLNPGIREELRRVGVDDERILGIPNGVNTQLFEPADAASRLQICDELEAEAAQRVFVCPSRFAPKKRLPELVELWRDVQGSSSGGCALWVVGDPQHEVKRGRVSRAVEELLNEQRITTVRLLPGMPHHLMPRFYQGADAYVSLSVQEGMSNAMLEAMACGLPVVAPATDAVTQLIGVPTHLGT